MVKSVIANELNKLIGEEVWFRAAWNDVNSGILMCVKGGAHAQIKVTSNGSINCGGETCIHANDIFLTKDDLLGANYERYKSKVSAYCSEIKTVEDLVKFSYNHRIAEGDECDFEARDVVRKRAKELLGVEIDPVSAKMETDIEKALNSNDMDDDKTYD